MKKIFFAAFWLLTGVASVQAAVTFTAQPGHSYIVQTNANRALDRFWGDAQTVTNVGLVSVPMDTSGPQGFYRVLGMEGPVFWYGWSYQPTDPTFRTWGFGTQQVSYVHNDRSWDWFCD